MAELQDFRLNHPDVPSDSRDDPSFGNTFGSRYSASEVQSSYTKWIILVVILFVAAAVGYFALRRTTPAAPQKAVAVTAPPAAVAPVQPREEPSQRRPF